MNNKIINIFFLFCFFFFIACKKTPIDCSQSNITIANRWYTYNGGADFLKIKNQEDIVFICNRIDSFSEGEDVRVNYNYGYLSISLNGQKIDVIFTVNNGVVYEMGKGKYVYDELLTNKIMKLMKINNRCWGIDCN